MPRPDAIQALKELDPGQRALLDLSLNREMSDAMISALLEDVDEPGVAGMRTEALTALALAAEIDGPNPTDEVERQLRSASDQQWLGAGKVNGNGNGHRNGVVATVPLPAHPRRSKPAQQAEPQRGERSGRIWAVAFALLALIGAISIAAALIGGDDDSPSNTSAETREAPSGSGAAPGGAANPAAPAEPVAFEALTPGAVAGAVTIAPAADGERYVLRLDGLPQSGGYYRLWLYDSLIESAPVAGLASGSGSVAFELPADAGGYENLDLSVESGPGDTIHSGQSIFRVSLADID